ncbi:MAG: DUF2232 domain-containing protein [Gemmatimonadaceae bacterium]|nr:DUF2232 domain-containing protein [Gemmatimonadaceae bacterium]
MTEAGPASPQAAPPAARSERSWGKFLLALLALLLLPAIPQMRALLPVEQTTLLLVPAIAACALVGWWAGGSLVAAIAWVGLAVLVTVSPAPGVGPFRDLARGWGLLVAGSFGLVCLFGTDRPFLSRALTALVIAMVLAVMMGGLGAVGGGDVHEAVSAELARRNAAWSATVQDFIMRYPDQWGQVTERMPQAAEFPAESERQLATLSRGGAVLFPALLSLESLAALAVAWAAYHRIGRTRLGAPLAPLKEFRFNDQLVWGLIVGLVLVVLPTLAMYRAVGGNLLVFFGALYAVRGLGVLAWFLAPGALTIAVSIGFAMLWWPVLNVIAVLGFMILLVASFGLGLGDTWADWRSRARPTT